MTSSGQYPNAASRAALERSRWLLRLLLCHLLPAWCWLALGAAPAAAAAPAPLPPVSAEAAAPMCDPMGASVPALPDIPEVDRGGFEELPCEALLLMTGWRLDAPELGSKAALHDPEPQQPQSLHQYTSRYDGACDFSVAFPSRAEPSLAGAPLRHGLSARQAHELGVYRPPLART